MNRPALLGCMIVGLAALSAPPLLSMSPQGRGVVVYNPTDSVPRGWYGVRPVESQESLVVDQVVLARMPAEAATFASQRGYLPNNVPLLKRIGAVSPQLVCVANGVVRVDGAAVATARTFDGLHRPLHAWANCRSLDAGELFLLSRTNPASFDSRYFGPIETSAVLGLAMPLWTWSD